MNALLFCFLLSSFVGNAFAATFVVDPLDTQLPLIARVNQPFSWTFSARTFNSSDGTLNYTTSTLPGWLSFNPGSRTFSGTPAPEDEGNPRVVVTARTLNPNSYASSGVNLCVTHYPPPTIGIPISEQFAGAPSPAISSVFALQPRSALATASNATLRIPRGWSFSIGFQRRTITSDNPVFYEARSADGSELPEWMAFDSNDITLDGVVPNELGTTAADVVSLVLVGSDQEGYTALVMPFDLVIADHELSASTNELPTINVTSGNPFAVNLTSPADFTGILIDGDTIQPSNITSLGIDTSDYTWLQYDPISRTLSGTPSSDTTRKPKLPVALGTIFNQTIQSTVTLQLVDSYFSQSDLPALHLSPGDEFSLQLDQFYSNSTAGQRGDADVSGTFDPLQAADFIYFDASSDNISGRIPSDFVGDHIAVSLTAYSRITHSTSHANLVIFISPSPGGRNGQLGRPTGLSVQAKRRLALGLGITFGGIGSLVLMIAFFAVCRRIARVEDSALTGEEGRMGWSEKDKRYYGFASNSSLGNQRRRPEDSPQSEEYMAPSRNAGEFGPADLRVQRMPERNQSNAGSYTMTSEMMSSAMMSKREFVTRIKQTVRQVSSKYTRKPRVSPPRPAIGKPILLRPSVAGVSDAPDVYPLQGSTVNPFDDRFSQRGSTFMTGSPSTSTAEHSIPRRRADFAPPRAMAQVHFEDGRLVRQGSTTSLGSDRHDRTSRQTSVHSGRSTSYLSHEYFPEGSNDPAAPSARPRLVPFTSSTRVPVPRVSSLVVPGGDEFGAAGSNFAKSRIASQRARVFKEHNANGDEDPFADKAKGRKSVSADDLSMGLHYVQLLGNDQTASESAGAAKSEATSSQEATRFAVRTGEKFHIRIQIPVTTRPLQVQQVSGLALPSFLRFDANGAKGIVEFTGTALSRDLGALNVGVYADKDCLSRVIIEVIPRR